jgi:hypothetical protein
MDYWVENGAVWGWEHGDCHPELEGSRNQTAACIARGSGLL